MNILQAAGHIIEAVFALPVFVVFAGNGYHIKLGGQQVFGIFKSKAHLRQPAGTAAFAAIKHQALQVFTPQVANFMLANYPADAVDNIAFATAVWPDNAGNAFIKMKHSFIRKTFKPFNFKTL